ncbi:MAG TPA: hypothetical protein VFV99_28785 [Kofleriaceae bacterium]|nr:hypothetical protein [Kofleriaceae bacterium]
MLMLLAASPTVVRAAGSVASCPNEHCDIPECTALAWIPPDALIDTPKIAARVSVAMCAAGKRMSALTLKDDAASRVALNKATAPTFAVLDDLASTGTPDWQIIANALRGQLYVAMTVRLRNSIPPINQAMGPQYAALMARHDRVEQEAQPWLASADDSFRQARQVASVHPELGNNPVVSTAERNSAASLVAARAPAPARPSACCG